MEELEISSKEYEIPKVFLDADYIPTELICRGFFPRFVWIDGKRWVANLREGYPFYERYKRERKKDGRCSLHKRTHIAKL